MTTRTYHRTAGVKGRKIFYREAGDPNISRSILDYRGHGDCGIYAEIVNGGRLVPGNALHLMDDRQETPGEPHLA